ncbi:internal (core) protein [Enterobacter phage 01_vB_Eclo_IJM]|nr:internal (core) protein [Enterobacter phage 01_vB_Eclo_IJM]
MTPQRQMLITAEANLLEAVKRKSVEQAKANTKLIQQQNKQLVIDDVYNRRLAGENVSTNYEDLPVNESTGEFKRSDMNNYAQSKLAQIDQWISLRLPKMLRRWLCCELTPITVRSATPSRRLRKMLLVSGKLRSSVVSTTQTRCSASSPT